MCKCGCNLCCKVINNLLGIKWCTCPGCDKLAEPADEISTVSVVKKTSPKKKTSSPKKTTTKRTVKKTTA